MSMFDISPEFAEQLGAYIEGNLSYEDTCQMEQMISANEDLSSFVNELNEESLIGFNDFAAYDYLNMDVNFALPDLPDYRIEESDVFFSDATNIFEDSTMKFWDEDDMNYSLWGDDTDFSVNNDNDLII